LAEAESRSRVQSEWKEWGVARMTKKRALWWTEQYKGGWTTSKKMTKKMISKALDKAVADVMSLLNELQKDVLALKGRKGGR